MENPFRLTPVEAELAKGKPRPDPITSLAGKYKVPSTLLRAAMERSETEPELVARSLADGIREGGDEIGILSKVVGKKDAQATLDRARALTAEAQAAEAPQEREQEEPDEREQGRLSKSFEMGAAQAAGRTHEFVRDTEAALEEGILGRTQDRVRGLLGLDPRGGKTAEERAQDIRDAPEKPGEIVANQAIQRLQEEGFAVTSLSDVKGLRSMVQFGIENAVTSLPQMGVTLAAGPLTAPATIAMLGAEANDELKERTDLSEADRVSIATGAGSLMFAFDAVGLGRVVGGLGVGGIAKKAAQGELVDHLVKGGLKKSAARVLEAAVHEGATESIQEGIVLGATSLAGGEYEAEEVRSRLVEAFAGGAGAGGAIRGAVEPVNAVAERFGRNRNQDQGQSGRTGQPSPAGPEAGLRPDPGATPGPGPMPGGLGGGGVAEPAPTDPEGQPPALEQMVAQAQAEEGRATSDDDVLQSVAIGSEAMPGEALPPEPEPGPMTRAAALAPPREENADLGNEAGPTIQRYPEVKPGDYITLRDVDDAEYEVAFLSETENGGALVRYQGEEIEIDDPAAIDDAVRRFRNPETAAPPKKPGGLAAQATPQAPVAERPQDPAPSDMQTVEEVDRAIGFVREQGSAANGGMNNAMARRLSQLQARRAELAPVEAEGEGESADLPATQTAAPQGDPDADTSPVEIEDVRQKASILRGIPKDQPPVVTTVKFAWDEREGGWTFSRKRKAEVTAAFAPQLSTPNEGDANAALGADADAPVLSPEPQAEPGPAAPADSGPADQPAPSGQTAPTPTPEAAQPPVGPTEAVQPDMLGGRDVPEGEMARKESERRAFGRMGGMIRGGRTADVNEQIGGLTIKGRGENAVTISGPGGRIIDTVRTGNPEKAVSTVSRLVREARVMDEIIDEEIAKRGGKQGAENTADQVRAAAAEADPNPTPAQAEAGNYKKGRTEIQGLKVAIENAKGATRRKMKPDGSEAWSVVMPADYGDLSGTKGADGDPIDVYIGDNPDGDFVLIVNQIDPETGAFDEHKVIMGTGSEAAARRVYEAGFSDGSGKSRIGSATATSVAGLKAWLESAEQHTQPTEPVKAADGPQPDSASDIVSVTDVYGDRHRVRKADLDGDRPMLRRFNASGDPMEGQLLARENIDTDGTGVTATFADAPVIGIGRAADAPAKTEAQIKKAIKRRGQDLADFDIQKVDGGFLGVRKPAAQQPEAERQRPQIGSPDYTLIDARNDLIDMRTQLEAQGQVQDARLASRVDRQAELVKRMEREAEPADKTDAEVEAEMAADMAAEQKRKDDAPKPNMMLLLDAGMKKGASEDMAQLSSVNAEGTTKNWTVGRRWDSQKGEWRLHVKRGTQLDPAKKITNPPTKDLGVFANPKDALSALRADGMPVDPDAGSAAATQPVTAPTKPETDKQKAIRLFKEAIETGNDTDAGKMRAALVKMLGEPATARIEAEARPAQEATAPAAAADPKPTGILSVLSDEKQARAADLKRRLADKARNQTSSGIDPEYITLGGELVGLYVEAGTKRFGQMLRDFAETTGLSMREAQGPMRAAYNFVRDEMDLEGRDVSDMDSADAVMAEIRQAIAEEKAGNTATAEASKNVVDSDPPNAEGAQTDGNDGLVQAGEREAGGGNAGGEQTGNRPDRALEGPQPEDGGADGEGGGAGSGGARSGRSNAGRSQAASEGGDASNGRAGTGRSGVASDGARKRTRKPDARTNYVISDPEAVIGGTPMVRFRRNQAAIEAFNDITAEGREPTQEELDAMAGYTGWGSFGQELFQGSWERPRPKDGWADRDTWLRDQLGEEGWKSAQASIINAHYTDPPTVQAMWSMVEAMGFKGGRVLEPAMGIGNFFGLMPQKLARKSDLTGIELDRTTGGMAKILYPQANVSIKGYETSKTPDGFYDLVIGNWPFASQSPADRRYNTLSPSLHDYFFVKALDQTRAGGLVVGVTSSGTMDKLGTATRDHIARKADLVAAYRLPSGAFEKYAGTSVVTDILVFRKRAEPRLSTEGLGWINATDMQTPAGSEIRVNEFYQQNPDNVLGRLNFVTGTTQGRAGMIVERPDDLMERLESLPSRVPKDAYQPVKRGKEERFLTNNTADRQGSVVVAENDLWVTQGERLVPLDGIVKWQVKDKKKTEARREAITALVDIRKAYGATIDAERDGAADTEAKRKDLNARYKRFRKKFGSIQDSEAIKLVERAGDPNAAMLQALERRDGTPSDVLTEPLTRSKSQLENPSISDAYVVARNESAALDLERVAELSGKPVAEVEAQLLERKAIYRMPGGGYEISDLFLSGNVRRRLRALEEARDGGEANLADSIEAIKAVVPKDVPYYKIDANMGAVWIDAPYYQDFTAGLLGLTDAQKADVKINFIAGTWSVKFENRTLLDKPEATTQHGTTHTKFDRILRAAMNNESLKVFAKDENGNRVLDTERSKEANEKAEKLRETFKEWVFRDPERRVDLSSSYNEAMNAIATPSFDGSFLEFPGMALRRGDGSFSLRSHQVNAIWRGVASGRGIYAHEVGTGKTYTIAGIAIESRRYGLARKPMILAHNANSATVASEINDMYPGAKVLYVSNLDPKNINRTLYSIRNDDWDAIVIPHSVIDRIGLTEQTLRDMMAEDIAALETAALEAASDDGVNLDLKDMDNPEVMKKVRSVTAKELVKARNSIIEKIRKNAQKASKEGAVTFEDLGVDMLLIDEAHEFKKPSFVTKMRLKGLQSQTSAKAIQVQFLTRYVRKMNAGRGVHAFTGTPITNTLTEMFHMMRYVMEDTMDENSVGDWDGWFNTFAAAESDIEIASDGQFEPVTRLSSFVNVPELRRMAGEYLDIVFADEMPEFSPRQTARGKTMKDTLSASEESELRDGRTENPVGRPYKKVVNDTQEMNDTQREIQKDLARRYDVFRKASPQERKAIITAKAGSAESHYNPLLISLEADAAAFDIRLRDPEQPDLPGSKVNRAVRNVLTHYREHPKAAQVIFMDKGYENFGTTGGKRVPRTNIAQDIKAKLVSEGVQEAEIAIVTGSTSKIRRKELAKKVERAEIRVIIGGTSTLGVGVNMQENLRAMHHLDAPWMPGELEQRNGRGQRQGNAWNTVMEYRYMTERLDAKRWQTLAKKQRFITDFMHADMDTRIIDGDAVDAEESASVDDITSSLSDAAGDPRIMQRMKLSSQVDKLQRRQSSHDQGVVEAGRQAERLRARAAQRESKIKAIQGDVDNVAALRESDAFAATIDGKAYSERADAIEALDRYLDELTLDRDATADFVKLPVQVQGFTLEVMEKWSGLQFRISRSSQYAIGKGSIAAIESNIRAVPKKLDEAREEAADLNDSAARLEAASNEPFAQQDQLAARVKQLQAIEADLVNNPVPAPLWLRQGAPVDTKIMVGGEPRVVTGHRWDSQGYFVLTDEGDVPYLEARAEDGGRIYDETEFTPPPEASERNQEAPQSQRPDSRGAMPAADRRRLKKSLRAELDRIGLSRVRLSFDDSMSEQGQLRMDADGALNALIGAAADPTQTVRHEAIHAMKAMGLFRDTEWAALTRAAERDWMERFDIAARYPDLSRDAQIEEAIAEAYAVHRAANLDSAAPILRRALNAVRALLDAVRAALGADPDGPGGRRVLDAVDSGEIGARDAMIRSAQWSPKDQRQPSGAARGLRQKAGDLLSDQITDAMNFRGLLALVPGRALVSEIAKVMPSSIKYQSLKDRMDADRAEMHDQTANRIGEWRKIAQKDSKANASLMDLMHRATLAGIDPSRAFKPGEMADAARETISRYGRGNKETAWAEEYLETETRREDAHGELSPVFNALPPAFQGMFRKVLKDYRDNGDAWQEAVLQNIEKAAKITLRKAERAHDREMTRIKDEGLKGEDREAALAAANEALKKARARSGWALKTRISKLRAQFETNRMSGPYVPLGRFGNYYVTLRDETGQVVSFSRFETAKQQRKWAKEAEASGEYATVQKGTLQDKDGSQMPVNAAFAGEVDGILGDSLDQAFGDSKEGTDLRAKVMHQIWQKYLATLPDHSVRTSQIHRKGRAGFAQDAIRTYSHHMFHSAHQLARLRYSMEMHDALDQMGVEADNAPDPNRAMAVRNELARHLNFAMNPASNPFVTFSGQAAFVWYLGVSPAAAFVNLTQTTINGPAMMMGEFQKASVGDALSALGGASRDFTLHGFDSRKSKRITTDERAAVSEAYSRSIIERTQSHDLAAVAETGVEYNDRREKVMRGISFLFHHAERANREVTFLAAYRLGRAEGRSHEASIEAAASVTYKTHFDYQNTARPRIMQNDTGKFFMIFRQHSVNMLYRFIRDTQQTFHGATPEDRRAARRQVVGLSLSMMLHAGIRGAIGYNLMMMLLGALWPDEEDKTGDELLHDFMLDFIPGVSGIEGTNAGWMWQHLASATLDGPMGYALDWNLRDRIGMPSLWFRPNERLQTASDQVAYYVTEMAGPAVGLVAQMANGVDKMLRGEIYRGVETVSPKFVRDLMRAGRYSAEGVRTERNDYPIIDDTNWWQELSQAMGMTSGQLAERYQANTRMMNRQDAIQSERSAIMRRAGNAILKGNPIPKKVMEDLRDFNRRFPTYPIEGKNIRSSVSGRMRSERRNEFGIQLSPRLNDRIREEAAPLKYN